MTSLALVDVLLDFLTARIFADRSAGECNLCLKLCEHTFPGYTACAVRFALHIASPPFYLGTTSLIPLRHTDVKINT